MTTAAIASTNITTSGTIVSTGDITAPNLYTKTNTNTLLNGKLNTITGDSISIKNNSGADVAVFWGNASKDVELKGNCCVSNNLSVLNTGSFTNTLSAIVPGGGGGSIRVIASTNGDEASIGYYNYNDSRSIAAGDMWVGGANCWSKSGYSIGTSVLGYCLNINNTGVVSLANKLRTPELLVNTIRGNGETQITIDDNVIISNALSTPVINTTILRVDNYTESSGQVYESVYVLNATNNTVLTFYHMRGGIITCLNTANGLTLTLPTGTAINAGMIGVGYNQSLKWSVINLSSSTGNVGILTSSGHTYVGNYTLTPNASYRCLTVLTGLTTAITFRIS
jgi:hypothetical protein